MDETTSLRTLGRSGVRVSAMGMGCWAIGGPFEFDGKPDGWGEVDDSESIRAIHRALDLGITLFDTADVYGAGHSERKQRREITGVDVSAAYIRSACAASLRRLGTDSIDLYQLHVGWLAAVQADEVAETLERLCDEGLIRAYGWSTDDAECARRFVGGRGFTAVQHEINVLRDSAEIIALCEAEQLASLNRGPLAMGLLSGKFQAGSELPADDVRGSGHTWLRYFRDRRPAPEFLAKLVAVREILTSGGRTLAQGALAWLWGRSSCTIPIPGFKNVRQVEENAGALRFGPLTASQMREIEGILSSGA
jgi:aryl-alcohol dehydrogenase-like predicted oxidoreductase